MVEDIVNNSDQYYPNHPWWEFTATSFIMTITQVCLYYISTVAAYTTSHTLSLYTQGVSLNTQGVMSLILSLVHKYVT